MGVQNPNSTSYVHPDEPNLLNLHKAMVQRDDEPHLRVTLGTDNITITGYAQGTFTGDIQTALNFLNMGSNIDYTYSDVVVLMVKLLVGGTDNSSVMGTINYTEDL